MKKIVFYLIIICTTVFPGEIPGFYKCKSVLVEQYRNGAVSRKRISAKSLYLNITRNKIEVFGIESGRSICKDLPIVRIFRDTLFIIPRLSRDMNGRARLYFKSDTLTGDYNFLDNGASDSVTVKIVTSKSSQSVMDRLQRQCK